MTSPVESIPVNDERAPIESLDHETLAKIIKYLRITERLRLERVCRRWREIIRRYAWDDVEELDLFDRKNYRDLVKSKKAEAITVQLLLRCVHSLRKIAVPEEIASPKILSMIRKKLRNLREIQVQLDKKKLKDFEKSAYMNSECEDSAAAYFQKKLDRYLNFSPELTKISLIFPASGSDIQSALPRQKFSRLQSLQLKTCRLNKEMTRLVSSEIQTLVDLDIRECKFETPSLFVLKLGSLKRLTIRLTLNIYNCLESVDFHCPNIEYINIKCCEVNMGKLAGLKKLRTLITDYETGTMNGHDFFNITNNCLELDYLDLRMMCRRGFDLNFFNALSTIKRLTNLKHLRLWTKVDLLDDTLMLSIIQSCSRLQSIKIVYNSRLTELFYDSLKNLEYLEEIKLKNFFVVPIHRIIGNCKNLKRLAFTCRSEDVPEIGILNLPTSQNLEALAFKYSAIIDDEFVLSISNKYKNLKTLNLFACKNVISPQIEVILENCPKLQSLNLEWTGIGVDILIRAAKTKLKNQKSNNNLLTIFTSYEIFQEYKNINFKIPSHLLFVDSRY